MCILPLKFPHFLLVIQIPVSVTVEIHLIKHIMFQGWITQFQLQRYRGQLGQFSLGGIKQVGQPTHGDSVCSIE